MEKLLVSTMLSMLVALQVYAQNDDKMKIKNEDVPQAVRSAFEREFPNTSDVDWKMMNAVYKTTFRVNKTKHIAEFNPTGALVSKGMRIENSEVPKMVSDAVRKNYPNSEIDDAYQLEKSGQTRYLIELDGNPDRIVVFDSQGKIIKEKSAASNME